MRQERNVGSGDRTLRQLGCEEKKRNKARGDCGWRRDFVKMRLKYLKSENSRKTKILWGGGGVEYTPEKRQSVV